MSRDYAQAPYGGLAEDQPFDFGTEFVENAEPRCPCVLLLDTSGSMSGEPIAELNAGLRSFQEELVYSDELRQMAAAHPESVWFTPTVSRPHDPRNAGWTGRTGRVNALVEDYLRERGIGRDGTLVYACGHPGMIEDVKARMGHAGYRFREERFWKE